jgi:DNA-binding CsgD family transcriptional regulator
VLSVPYALGNDHLARGLLRPARYLTEHSTGWAGMFAPPSFRQEHKAMDYLKHLPKRDLISLLEIADETRMAMNVRQFRGCFNKLKTMMLCEGGFCVFADKEALDSRQVPVLFSHTQDFSDEFLKQYVNGRCYENSAVIKTIFKTWQPLNWRTAWSRLRSGNGARSMRLAKAYGYMDGWTHANYHPNNITVSVITFAGKKVENDQRTMAILKYVVPHLAESFRSIFNSNLVKVREGIRFRLTPRELEILKWIEGGKSTWDISMILSRSERVVKWHVNNLMQKLSAQNRTQAVAIGLRLGLLD